MSGFTKLFHSILDSSIWSEPHTVRLVWITMLAMSDRNGEVQAALPGLANRAQVTLRECQEALEILKAPDPFSRTKDDEGRRVREVDGGWVLLNHGKYRSLLSAEERKEYKAKKQREYRARAKSKPDDDGGKEAGAWTNCPHVDSVDTVQSTDSRVQSTENSTPLTPQGGKRLTAQHLISLIPDEWPEERKVIAAEWAEEKQAKGSKADRYQTETGWRANLKRMERYPVAALRDAVELAIASGWKGWEHDKVKQQAEAPPKPKATQWAPHQLKILAEQEEAIREHDRRKDEIYQAQQ